MDIVEVGAEGHGVEPRDLAAEQAALESCVDGFDLHVLAILALINLAHHIAQMRLPAVFPRGVFARDTERAAEAFSEQPDSPDEQLLAAGDRASDRARARKTRLADLENAKVAGGLHEPRNVHAHRLNAVGVEVQEAADLLGVHQAERLACDRAGGKRDGNVGVCGCVFLAERFLQFLADRLRARKLSVFQRDDGSEVVIRQMGCKDMKIVYDDRGGTKEVKVPELEALRWALSLSQAETVAKGVRAISKQYGGIIMDTEFCIDAHDKLWFVQARPETRWNSEHEQHPHTIFMRRREVDPEALASAETVLEGNGASRGAGHGVVRFLRSALELNKVNKGDVLAAERTDPDMVPGMRIATAIMADVGGDTSHAAITSRELGIPAVIGIQHIDAIRALDGMEVTVDGSRGRVYRGLLPLKEVGGEINIDNLPETKCRVGLILADVGQALALSRLRVYPRFKVGLLRAEFMLGNVAVHPQALEAYDNGELDRIVKEKVAELDANLTKVICDQLDGGMVAYDFNIREYVGVVSGLSKELEQLVEEDKGSSAEEILLMHRKMRELDHKLDAYLENASRHVNVLKTSVDLAEHVKYIMGYDDELSKCDSCDPEGAKRISEIQAVIDQQVSDIKDLPLVQEHMKAVAELREKVSVRAGLKKEIDDVRELPQKISKIIRSRGFRTGREHYIQTLAQSLALFAMAFYGKTIVYRTTATFSAATSSK